MTGEGQPARRAPVDILRKSLLPVHLGHHAVVEAIAIEVGDTAVGGRPQVSFPVLVDAEDGVVGQSVPDGIGAKEVSFLCVGGGEGSYKQHLPTGVCRTSHGKKAASSASSAMIFSG